MSRHSVTNRYLWMALGSVVGVQVLVVELPFLQGVFDTVGLSIGQWGICVGLALAYVLVDEVRSLVERVAFSDLPE
ncbi:MAG: cation-translocating P-type ATPase C-terminal domain-containing protein [Microthrixaceae bacterium]|nr:cation-translocating P-type ATPase C-terminal domain-containing protein [Microthrixaceae bacterium]